MHQPPRTYNPESPFKVRRAEAQDTASSWCLKEHNSHFSCDAGLLGSEAVRKRKLKVEEGSSNCSSQGPERASTTYEPQLRLGLYPSSAEKESGTGNYGVSGSQAISRPIEQLAQEAAWLLLRTLLSSWSQTRAEPLLSIKVCPAREHRLISRVLMKPRQSESPPG